MRLRRVRGFAHAVRRALFLIAIQFIIFDLEIIFIVPWATVFRDLGMVGLIEMGIFASMLLLGFIYVWKKGALEWE